MGATCLFTSALFLCLIVPFSFCFFSTFQLTKCLLGFSPLAKIHPAPNQELPQPIDCFLSLFTIPGIIFLLLSVHHSKCSPLFSFDSSSVQGAGSFLYIFPLSFSGHLISDLPPLHPGRAADASRNISKSQVILG